MKKWKMFEQTETRPRHNCDILDTNDTIVYPDTILKNNLKKIIKNKNN